jgi:hypothetical protein
VRHFGQGRCFHTSTHVSVTTVPSTWVLCHISHVRCGGHPPDFMVVRKILCETPPAPAWEGRQGAQAAPAGKGTTVPLSPTENRFPPWPGRTPGSTTLMAKPAPPSPAPPGGGGLTPPYLFLLMVNHHEGNSWAGPGCCAAGPSSTTPTPALHLRKCQSSNWIDLQSAQPYKNGGQKTKTVRRGRRPKKKAVLAQGKGSGGDKWQRRRPLYTPGTNTHAVRRSGPIGSRRPQHNTAHSQTKPRCQC